MENTSKTNTDRAKLAKMEFILRANRNGLDIGGRVAPNVWKGFIAFDRDFYLFIPRFNDFSYFRGYK